MFMKQRVKQLAITERSVKMKKIVAVVIIMFIFSIIILGVGSKLVFQKIWCGDEGKKASVKLDEIVIYWEW